ncbi:MAG: hypothetical protein RSD27_01740 [Ruthenibacterium sp.]
MANSSSAANSGVTSSVIVPAAEVLTPDVVPALELGFSAVILSVGLVGGFALSRIINWWKW